ncbi:MAG: hypothetical protein J2P45_03560, partial [Candidatus Dormibacteraeota bacterium]|nr:hypothetical protein [Candidatus Dormibacteraeota bacterium]
DWGRFQGSKLVGIATSPSTNDGQVLDVEPGDATPDEAAGWIRMRQAAGLAVPTIYVNRSQAPAVVGACMGLNYHLWVSTLDGTQQIPGWVYSATQYATIGGYDESVVTDPNFP